MNNNQIKAPVTKETKKLNGRARKHMTKPNMAITLLITEVPSLVPQLFSEITLFQNVCGAFFDPLGTDTIQRS